jgi:hypothetical protein
MVPASSSRRETDPSRNAEADSKRERSARLCRWADLPCAARQGEWLAGANAFMAPEGHGTAQASRGVPPSLLAGGT